MRNIYVVLSKYEIIWRIFTNERKAVNYKVKVSNDWKEAKPFKIYKFTKYNNEIGYIYDLKYEK